MEPLFVWILWCLLLPSSGQAQMNMEFASQLVLGQDDGNWQEATESIALHQAGLLGAGQVLGLGDTGVDTQACAFRDSSPVPYGHTSSDHRKIAGYFTAGGDQQDGPDGHGTHIAAAMVGHVQSPDQNLGIAPRARLVVVDVERSNQPGTYNLPEATIETSYFDQFRLADALVVCSPWSFDQNAGLQNRLDRYVWNHPEFLPVFPSGNVLADATEKSPQSPCSSKNALCVGASYNSPRMYQEQPSFVHSALQVDQEELIALPAFFGSTEPQALQLCEAVANDCFSFKAACPECAFPATRLREVAQATAWEAEPADGCSQLTWHGSGVCVVRRGSCDFVDKARHCVEAGAVGVVVINGAGEEMTVMRRPHNGQSYSVNVPVVLVSHADGSRLLQPGARLTFPVVSSAVMPHAKAPYSRYGPFAGRIKPEVILPGDGITSAAAAESCGFRQMSGTSQSCGLAAGVAALVREYLRDWADSQARLEVVLAATIKAALVTAAELDGTSTLTPEEGFGLPRLATLLPMPSQARPGLVTIQSYADDAQAQNFCLRFGALAQGSLAVSLAWTDPPSANGALVHDLDLQVSCDVSNWRAMWGNGGDSANNVEKVSLMGYGSFSSALCIARVTAKQVSALSPQAFSLVASGPFTLAPCLAPRPLVCVHGAPEQLAEGYSCRCVAPYVGPFCDQEVSQVTERWTGELRPWQWLFVQAPVSCAGSHRLVIQGATRLKTHLAWGHLHTVLADQVAVPGVSFMQEEDSTAALLTVLVRVEAEALSHASSVSLGLQWQERSGKSNIAISWSPEPGTECGGGAPGTVAANYEHIVLIACLVVFIVAVVVACVVFIKLIRGREKVSPEGGDVEQAGDMSKQWQCQS